MLQMKAHPTKFVLIVWDRIIETISIIISYWVIEISEEIFEETEDSQFEMIATDK